MDIDGAKALNERLARRGAAAPQPVPVDAPADAPPVYRWFGIVKSSDDAGSLPGDVGPADAAPNLGSGPLGFPPASQ